MSDILFTARLAADAAATRRDQIDGREYLVVPAVAIRAGVLNGYYVPADEIAAYVDAWNGRPVTLRHPADSEGYISANSPTVLARAGLGSLFNSRMDGDRLHCELWVDVAKATALGGDALAVLQRFEAGEPTEVSTGYFCDIEETAGVLDGKPYAGIQRNIRPDHIAALPGEVGACSWRDGCGAPRVNLAVNQDNSDGVMLAFYLRQEDAQALALTDAPDGAEALPANELHITLAYLGKVDEVWVTLEELLNLAMDFARYSVIVPATVHGHGRFYQSPDSTDPEAVFAIVQSDALYEFRERLCEWLDWIPVERRAGYLPHITLAYAPAGVDVPLSLSEREIVLDALAVSWGASTIVFPLQGQIREEFNAMTDQEKAKAKVTPKPKVNEGADAEQAHQEEQVAEVQAESTAVEQPASVEIPAEVVELAAAVQELGGVNAIREAIQSIQVNARRMRGELVDRLIANRQCKFTKERLDAMSLEDLETLERTLRPADYQGRNGVTSNAFLDDSEEWEEYKAPEAAAA